jgi:H+-transporting ATPase
MFPIGWRWALLIWDYAVGWFFASDRVKLGKRRIFYSENEVLMARFWNEQKQHSVARPA